MHLRDKVAIITGGGNGIGAAFARRFRAEGAQVVVTDIDADGVTAVAASIDAVAVPADVTREPEVQRVAAAALAEFGRVDLWFTNAGVSGPPMPGVLPDDEVWLNMWQLHVMAHVYAARAVLPGMVAQGDGYLLQTASSVALGTQPDKAAYAVTKHAALALGEWLALHYRPLGVKVSCFCPAAMRTRMLLANNLPEERLAKALSPEQAADIVVRGIEAERFLIVPDETQPQVLIAKADDYDAWLDGHVRRLAGEVGQ